MWQTVYLWRKDGEEAYASTRRPGKKYRQKLKDEGWEFYVTEVELPGDDDVKYLGRRAAFPKEG